jgi:large repetitive protein
MTRLSTLVLRVLGTLVAAGLLLLGMPMSPASAAAMHKFIVTADTPTITEGNAGTTSVTFTIDCTCGGLGGGTISVDWQTFDGTAIAGSDYTGTGGTATFTTCTGGGSQTVSVQVIGDLVYESTETFDVQLSNPVGANTSIQTGTATETVNDNDTAPSFSIDDVSHPEGDVGGTTYTFTVSRTGSTGLSSSVSYATADGSATTADSDYASTSGTLSFLSGDTTKTVAVTVNGDTKNESDETLFVNLSGAVNATISDSQGVGTVANDDSAPTISVDDQIVGEGDAGTTTMTFNVTLSNPSGQTITVDYTTKDGSATTGDNDYDAASGTVTFNPGDTTKPVDVTVSGDTRREPDQDFTLELSNPSNASIADAQGTGTITNDDPTPDASIGDTSVAEGDAGTATLSFDVTLSHATDDTVTVDWTTGNGTATTGDNDYDAASGTLTFLPGDISETVEVTVNGDTTYEADEDLSVTLSNPANAGIADGTGTGTITNDDGVPAISVDDQGTAEGNTGDNPVLGFTVTLSNPSDQTITVDYTTTNGTATTGDNDYDAASGTLTFDPGDTTKPVDVTVNGDDTYETTETFTVDLSNESGATVSDGTGTGTITNDDGTPAVSIADASIGEGDSGDATLSFDVTLSHISAGTVTVDYATADDTATTTDGDYAAATGTVTFDPGQDTKQVDVTVHGDATFEDDETLTVVLSNPNGTTIDVDTAIGTITNDDNPPAFSIDDVSKNEGNSGTTSFTFTVMKTGATALPASVDWATDGGTATPVSDYAMGSGTLNFPKNVSTGQITILVNGDTAVEANQTFDVTLSNEAGSTISDDTGVGTIKNDDRYAMTLTLKRRITTGTVVAKGILERATAGNTVRVALLRWKNGKWVRLAAKTITVTKIKDRDGDGKPDGRYRASFTRPTTHGRYKLRARFVRTSTQGAAKRKLSFRL